jgi:trehalose 6-phosphate synthase/phosphatase
MTTAVDSHNILRAYGQATSRLIILDYDGTLVPFEIYPDLAKPTPKVEGLLRYLAGDDMNRIILTSGRDKENMDAFFGDVPVILMAEHGAYVKEKDMWLSVTSQSAGWIPRAVRALNILKFMHEGSIVELKSLSVAWHYRAITDKVTPQEKRQIEADLRLFADYENLMVCHNEDTIELRTRGIDKGSAVARWVAAQSFDFIIAVGDSDTDEDLFRALPETAFTIKVGKSNSSAARFHLDSQLDVLPLLQKLAETENLMRDVSPILQQ